MIYGVYVHIPFCKSRCSYCGFYSTTLVKEHKNYINALCGEIDLRRGYTDGICKTVYIGGGTPSLLTADELERLLLYIYKVYRPVGDAEITVECNPDDLTPDYAKALKRMSVNRVSMGAQTFSDKRLEFLNRRHLSADVFNAVNNLKTAGIDNISIDLMFGFPGETLHDWAEDIDTALKLDVRHISAYSLMLEDDTPLCRMVKQGKIKEIDEELSFEMYKLLVSKLHDAGYEHYEISNFALPGFRSRHNSSYWCNVPYTGIGAAAHSYNLKSRQWNVSDVKKYIACINAGTVPFELEKLDTATMFNDMVTTAMRTSEGIDLDKVERMFGTDCRQRVIKLSERFISDNLAELTDNRLRLTLNGIFVSDMIMSELMIV